MKNPRKLSLAAFAAVVLVAAGVNVVALAQTAARAPGSPVPITPNPVPTTPNPVPTTPNPVPNMPQASASNGTQSSSSAGGAASTNANSAQSATPATGQVPAQAPVGGR